MNERRVRILLLSLKPTAYGHVPKGVGQKSVNIATELGFIESIKSHDRKRLPYLHRLTAIGLKHSRNHQ